MDTCKNSSWASTCKGTHGLIYFSPVPSPLYGFDSSVHWSIAFFTLVRIYLIPERVLLFREFNTINLQTTRSMAVWGKQRYSPCYWTKKDKTLFFYFCFQDFVAKFAAIVDSCRSYFSQAGLTAPVNCKLSSLIADFNLHNALSNQWRDHFLCQWKKGW